METKLKDRLKGSALYGMINNIEAIYKRVTNIFSDTASKVAVASFTPYEASEQHKTHMLETERKRSQALAEAQHQNPR